MSIPTEMIIKQEITTGEADRTGAAFYWRERDGVKVLSCLPLEEAGFVNGFSSRHGGVSPFPDSDLNLAGFNEDSAENIRENRRRFLALFGISQLATVWQVHGNDVKNIQKLDDVGDSEDKADALTSDLSGLLIGVKTADCVPVLIGDPTTGAFASIHAGWRGTAKFIVRKTVEKMSYFYGSRPADLVCALGPAASSRTYEIGPDVIESFAEHRNSASYFKTTRDGHATVDLHRANRDQLEDAGVNAVNIHATGLCTIERTDLFFSYRVEKRKFGKTGRLLSVIGRTQPR